MRLRPLPLAALVMAAMLIAAAGCEPLNSGYEPQLSADQTQCTSGQAQLEIGDGYQRILCGCAEAAGTLVTPDTTSGLTCTVPLGTTVFWEYTTTTVMHQIVSQGSPSFDSSPLSDPTNSDPVRSWADTFGAAGTYAFDDPFETIASGHIVVQ